MSDLCNLATCLQHFYENAEELYTQPLQPCNLFAALLRKVTFSFLQPLQLRPNRLQRIFPEVHALLCNLATFFYKTLTTQKEKYAGRRQLQATAKKAW